MQYDHYNHLFKSTVRMLMDTIDEIKASGVSDLMFMNMDAHAEIAEWPNQDILGLAQFGMRFDNQMVEVDVALGVSPWQDTHLFRHTLIMNRLVNKVVPTTSHPVYHADTGEKLGFMVVQNGSMVKGMERTESRPLQFIICTFSTSLTYSAS